MAQLAGKGPEGVEAYGEFLAQVGTQAANKAVLLGGGELGDKLQRMAHQAQVLLNYLVDDQPHNERLEAAANKARAAWKSTKAPMQEDSSEA